MSTFRKIRLGLLAISVIIYGIHHAIASHQAPQNPQATQASTTTTPGNGN